MGTVPPAAGYNAALRQITAEHGALLIIDEVMTGFRVSRGDWYGLDPVAADLFTFGKVMSGGLPAAAFGGRADQGTIDQVSGYRAYYGGFVTGIRYAQGVAPDGHTAQIVVRVR